MIEDIKTNKFVVESARQLFPKKPVFVSPVTLKQRFNVVATSKEPEPSNGELPPQVDVRQNSVFAAQWLLGSLKYLVQSGAKLVTYLETVSWCGFIQGDFNSPLPDKFQARKGDIFPVFTLMKEFDGFNDVIFSESDTPLAVDGIVLRNKDNMKVLITNFSDNGQYVKISGLPKVKQAKELFGTTEFTVKNEIIYLPTGEIVALTL